MNYQANYDDKNPKSIENYALNLIGKTFRDVIIEDDKLNLTVLEKGDYAYRYGNKKRKGGLGEIIEECFFHYKSNNDSQPDFYKAGVELKVTPYKINKNKSLSAKERLVITMIDYNSVINEEFENSHLWAKGRLILLIYYLYQQEVINRLNYRINYVKLFTPPEQDVKIIKRDYEIIKNKIIAGKAHELSESDTLYLGATPKASSGKDRRSQPFSDEPAIPRAFCYKNSYMTYVLNNYIVPNIKTYEPILKDVIDIDFEEYIIDKINVYKNFSVEELCKEFDVVFKSKPKNLLALLVYRILGIKGNQAEEFVKANIVIKTIRINKNNSIKEGMSFPTFKFKELIKEVWEDSTFGNYLRETRFLFVIFKYDINNILKLKGCQFWNIPYADLNEVSKVWNKTKQIVIDGLKITHKDGKNYSNFPKSSESRVCHVRPHGSSSKDTYELPDGRLFTKHCFWLNNKYILSQIEKDILEN